MLFATRTSAMSRSSSSSLTTTSGGGGSGSDGSSSSWGVVVVVASAATIGSLAVTSTIYTWKRWQARRRRQQRTEKIVQVIDQLHQDENDSQVVDDEALPSILSAFRDLQLDYSSSVGEANKRRTHKYYEMARDAHMFDLVPGFGNDRTHTHKVNYERMMKQRALEMKRIFRYKACVPPKSHRTVVVMCDCITADVLTQAREDILAPLQYSTDITTPTTWIPEASLIPARDLHVTIAIPWWWHTIRDDNQQLSRELVARFRQALVQEFHHAFQLELERIVLLGGRTLVALWRTIGEREAPDEYVIFDRHGESQDPIVKLRRDIVTCFTAESNSFGKQPLTYSYRYCQQYGTGSGNDNSTTTKDSNDSDSKNTETGPGGRPKLERQNTIEWKTPGLGDHDGFIHTTLARLPIDCLSMNDVELEDIHRLCREATATYCGHRMVVSKFRFLETCGEGGESNPCVRPLFDETIEAPVRVELAPGLTGEIQHTIDLHTSKLISGSSNNHVLQNNATIGDLPSRHRQHGSMDGLFDFISSAGAGSAQVSPKSDPLLDKNKLVRSTSSSSTTTTTSTATTSPTLQGIVGGTSTGSILPPLPPLCPK